MINLYTIGFTKKSAQKFFQLLREARVRTLADTRLNNSGQLAGFSKRDDLKYFLENLTSATYVHWMDTAPTDEMLKSYRAGDMSWQDYELAYRDLIASRHVENNPLAKDLDRVCLLCTEDKPHHCHRRILAEYLKEKNDITVNIAHL